MLHAVRFPRLGLLRVAEYSSGPKSIYCASRCRAPWIWRNDRRLRVTGHTLGGIRTSWIVLFPSPAGRGSLTCLLPLVGAPKKFRVTKFQGYTVQLQKAQNSELFFPWYSWYFRSKVLETLFACLPYGSAGKRCNSTANARKYCLCFLQPQWIICFCFFHFYNYKS